MYIYGRAMRRWQNVMEVTLLTLVLASTLCGCWTKTKSALILDEQWSVQQAKTDCESRIQLAVPRCSGDPAVEIRNFEVEIHDAFKSDPKCSGIVLLTLNVSNGEPRLSSGDARWLFLEPARGLDREKRWKATRSHNPSEHGSLTGVGEAKQVAHDSCRFVRGEFWR